MDLDSVTTDLKVTLPQHVAIIMDGNGRWAKEKHIPRFEGYREGARRGKEIILSASRFGIKWLTLYAFSNENWQRPKYQINFLMFLLKNYLREGRKEIMDNNIRFVFIGRKEMLPDSVKNELAKTLEVSKNNEGMTLCLAINYGGRQEIVDAARSIAKDVVGKKYPLSAIDEKRFGSMLYLPEMPDVDLVIRTSGEQRISNFLLWQISYAELWFCPVYWPDFTREHLYEALLDFSKRKRRFGNTL